MPGETFPTSGLKPEAACRELVRYVGDAPLVAFHASFDRSFLTRATKSCLGRPLPNEWLDLAELAPALKGRGLTSP